MTTRQRRPSSADRHSVASDMDLRSATEAMQRAAEAMIAATESFRQQFQPPADEFEHELETDPRHPGTARSRSASYSESSGSGANTATHRPDRHDRPDRPDRPDHSHPPRASSTRRRRALSQPHRFVPAPASAPPPPPPPPPALTPYTSRAPAPPVSLHNHHHLRPVTADATITGRPSQSQAKPDSERFLDTFPRATTTTTTTTTHSESRGRSLTLTEKKRLAERDRLEQEITARNDDNDNDDATAGPGMALVMSVSNPRQVSSASSEEKPQKSPALPTARPPPPQPSWSLMPKIPKTPVAASGPFRNNSYDYDYSTPAGARDDNPFAAVPVGARVSPGSTTSSSGRRPAVSSSYVDLIEAASRLKRTHSYQGGAHAGAASVHRDSADRADDDDMSHYAYTDADADADIELEPEPVLQIGRYTYVRSGGRGRAHNDPEHRASLIPSVLAATLTPASPPPPPQPPKKCNGPHGFSLPHEILFVAVVCLAQVLMLAGIAQALVPARLMGQSFPDTNPGSLAWYTAAYGLTSGTFVLPAGRLGDLFGHRTIFILGFLWFAAWSLVAGFAPMVQRAAGGNNGSGTALFIVARALQGVGPAMLVPNGQAMLGRAYAPGPRKNIVMSLLGASAPLGFVLGAVMSSLLAVYASWPWAFWTMAAVCVVLAAVSVFVLPADVSSVRPSQPPPPTDEFDLADDVDAEYDDDDVVVSKKKNARASSTSAQRESLWVRMDGLGSLLGVAGLVLVNFAFNQAPLVGWRTPYTYFLLIIGLLLLAAFLHVEARQAAHPLVPLAAMRATTNFVLGCTATGWGCFAVWVYYAVQVFENVRGWSPLHTSAAFAPAPVTGLVASLLTGLLFSRGVKPHWVMLVSMCAFFVGSLLFATSAPAASQLYWYNPFFSILVMPFGMDMSNPAATILLSNSVSRAHQGIAASLVVTFVNYAISLALGVAGSVEAAAAAAAADHTDLLVGYRAAQYFGLGLGGLGILLGTAFLCQSYLQTPQRDEV